MQGVGMGWWGQARSWQKVTGTFRMLSQRPLDFAQKRDMIALYLSAGQMDGCCQCTLGKGVSEPAMRGEPWARGSLLVVLGPVLGRWKVSCYSLQETVNKGAPGAQWSLPGT